MEKPKLLIEGVAEPVLNVKTIKQEKPTVLDLLTRVREEAKEKYGDALNEKHQLIIGETRHAIAMVFRDEDNRYLLVQRETIGKNPLANDNNQPEELAALIGYDFPVASRGVLPDSSFKVGNALDPAVIKDLTYIGTAEEFTTKLDAKNDAPRVLMQCYEAEVDREFIDAGAGNGGEVFTTQGVLEMLKLQCSSKIFTLRRYIKSRQ